MRLPAAWTGILLFAGVLAGFEWMTARRPPWLAARMLAAAVAGLVLYHGLPWRRLLGYAVRRPRWRNAALYFLFLDHFLRVFFGEILSLFRAWRLAAPHRRGRGRWRALACATTSLFPRTLRRAERFYAALLVNGLAK